MERGCEFCDTEFDAATGVLVTDEDGNDHWFDTAECNNDWLTFEAAKRLHAQGTTITAPALVGQVPRSDEDAVEVSLGRLATRGNLRAIEAQGSWPDSDSPPVTWTRYELVP